MGKANQDPRVSVVCETVRQLLAEKKTQQSEIEVRVGWSKRYLSQLLNGHVRINFHHLFLIGDALEIEPTRLFSRVARNFGESKKRGGGSGDLRSEEFTGLRQSRQGAGFPVSLPKEQRSQVDNCPSEARKEDSFPSLDELQQVPSVVVPVGKPAETLECQPILAWLDNLAASERVAAADDPACLAPAVVEGLLARCRGRWSDLPREALADAHLATELASRLSEDQDSFLADFDQPPLMARSWGARGNVLRILGDLPAAEWALDKAGELAGQPMVGKAARAEVFSFQASLEIHRRQFEEARRPLEEAAKLYGSLGDWHGLGRVLLQTSKMELKLGRPLVGLQAVQRGESMLHPEREPVLRWVAASIHLRLLCDLDRFVEAERLLPRAKEFCAQYGGALEHLRVLWWEGRIEAGLGRPSKAESAFSEVRENFLREGIGLDAALVTLDLAALYVTEGRWEEIPPLAAEVVAVLRGMGVEREVLAAMLLLAEANERQLAAGLLAEARQRLESNPRG